MTISIRNMTVGKCWKLKSLIKQVAYLKDYNKITERNDEETEDEKENN